MKESPALAAHLRAPLPVRHHWQGWVSGVHPRQGFGRGTGRLYNRLTIYRERWLTAGRPNPWRRVFPPFQGHIIANITIRPAQAVAAFEATKRWGVPGKAASALRPITRRSRVIGRLCSPCEFPLCSRSYRGAQIVGRLRLLQGLAVTPSRC